MRDAIQKSMIPADRIFLLRHLRDKHFDPVWHFHSEYQLFWVAEGWGTRFVGDSIKPFGKGELVFTGPGLPHLWRSDDIFFDRKSPHYARGIVLYLRKDFLGQDTNDKQELKTIRKLFDKSNRGLEFYGETRENVISLIREFQQVKGTKSIIQLLTILDTLARSGDYEYISAERNQRPFKEEEAHRLGKVYAWVMDHFRQEIRLAEIASHLFMTPTSFSRYFTMRTNKAFSKFVTEIRVQHACKLLVQEDFSIAAISYECGFKTLSNFNRQFRECMQQTPSEYRKQFAAI